MNNNEICISHLPSTTGNAAGGVGVAHVVDVAQKLKCVAHGRDDGVQTISDEGNLFVEFGIATQRSRWDISELDEVFLDAGSLLEEPFIKEFETLTLDYSIKVDLSNLT
jgi:hypothetical protein